MGIVHRAELRPSKLELLAEWLPGRDWFVAGSPIVRVSAFRFDDPDGEVGIETFIIGSGNATYHVPLTYRSGPLDDGEPVGELEHSALGHRWVYDGPSDPVYVDVTRTAIVNAERDVDMVLADGTPVPRLEWWGNATGTGAPAAAAARDLVVARALPAAAPADAPALTATWSGQETPLTLAWLA
jgi:hypothetical protein